MRIYHSGQPERKVLDNVVDYVYTEENTLMIDTECPHCKEKNRIMYVKHS
ncbi:hypothetical protein [Desulfitobacterium hafniense]|nr:hypothetical protein [Desulfitobacterium hafniense]